jgi:hypothetical protein
MSPKTICVVGAQTLSLAAVAWLANENHALRTQPDLREKPSMASARSAPGGTRASADARGESPASASASKRRPSDAGSSRSQAPPSKRPPLEVEAAADGGAVLRFPGVARRFDLTAEDLVALEQGLRAARQDATETRPGGPSWSPGQAAGAPDTRGHGDFRTAWASADPDGGKEWLQLSYRESAEIGEIVIHESYNPGAVSRVLALMPDGSERVLWEGTETTAQPGQNLDSVFKAPPGIRSDRIRVELDTSRVSGWNEIDAVEMIGTDGRRQWATESKASSYYGQNRGLAITGASEGFILDE